MAVIGVNGVSDSWYGGSKLAKDIYGFFMLGGIVSDTFSISLIYKLCKS